jgi:glycosyltransferase involved in cell wall biosynthesis
MKTIGASFIIPVYNGAAYIAEAVNSCLENTLKKIEVIVVDDCSTDSTVAILDALVAKDGRVRVIRHGANMGRSAARNTGCSAATSDVLMMMDHDDISLPDRAKTTVNEFKIWVNSDILYSQFKIIDELGNVKANVDVSPFDWEKLKETKLAYIGHSTMAFRRKVFQKVQYTSGDYCKHAIDDWKFQVDAYKAGFKFLPIRKCLAQYRWMEKKRDEAKILELKNACLI